VSQHDCDMTATTENGNVAPKTGNTYISGTMTDRMTIPTANLGFLTTPSAKKLTPGDCDNDRQPEMAIQTFWAPIFIGSRSLSQSFGYLLSSTSSSRIPNLALEFRRYLPEFQRCSSRDVIISGFGGHIDTSGCRSLLYSLANIIFHYFGHCRAL